MSTAPTPVDGIAARTVTGGGGIDVRVDETGPNTRTSFYPGVGHMPYLEDTDQFNRELREFVWEVAQ